VYDPTTVARIENKIKNNRLISRIFFGLCVLMSLILVVTHICYFFFYEQPYTTMGKFWVYLVGFCLMLIPVFFSICLVRSYPNKQDIERFYVKSDS